MTQIQVSVLDAWLYLHFTKHSFLPLLFFLVNIFRMGSFHYGEGIDIAIQHVGVLEQVRRIR